MSDLNGLHGEYFHRLHQLIQTLGADDELSRLDQKKLLIKPKASLAFPARDIDGVDEENGQISIRCQFMGLYGVDSPLPMYFNQYCLSDAPSSQVMRDFLDLFNHRSYALFFLAWRAFQPEFAIESGDRGFLDFITAMSGNLIEDDRLALSASIARSNSSSLYQLIQSFLPGCPVEIVESQQQWLPIKKREPLGNERAFVLADTSLIGERMVDASRSIRIDIGPISWEQSLQLLPEQALSASLWSLLNLHYGLFFDVSIKLLIKVDKSRVVLGQSEGCLGWQTWIGDWTNGFLTSLIKGTSGKKSD